MSAAVPQQLLSLPKVSGLKGIETKIIKINPTNASSSTKFSTSTNDRITFSIPAYKNGFFNPQRSFLQFHVKTYAATSVMANGIPVFNRMVLRTGNGVVIEDIQDYAVIQRILNNFEENDKKTARANMIGDYRSTDMTVAQGLHFTGVTYVHELISGILGKGQQHYVPLGLFNASGGFAFEIELYLENNNIAAMSTTTGVATYELSNVNLQMEIVTLPSTVTDRLNSELSSDNKVSVPFSTFRLHTSSLAIGSESADVLISESAHDLETIYSVLRPQVVNNKLSATSDIWYKDDNLSFLGGYGDARDAAGDANSVKSYQFRYDTKMYPEARAEMAANDSKQAMFNALHLLDISDKPVYCASVSGITSRWDENKTFMIVQNFKTSRDNFLAGLNSSSSGAPIELSLNLRSASTAALRIQSFVKSNYTLNIMKGGQTTLLNGGMSS